jgi:hypothetical protein
VQELLKKTETNNLKILSQNYPDGKNIDINEYENIMVELNESILVTVYISHLIRYSRTFGSYHRVFDRGLLSDWRSKQLSYEAIL